MSRILVSLVSEQTAPNLMLMLDPAFAGVDRYLLISTPKMNEQRQVEQLLSAAEIVPQEVEIITVPADDPQLIHQRLEEAAPAEAGEYLVNLTCGTKVMSLTVGNYFSQAAFDAQMFYVSLGENAYRRIYPLDEAEKRPLQYRFSLRTYLTGYGISQQPPEYHYRRSARVEELLLRDTLKATRPLDMIDEPIWWFAGHLDNHRRKILKSATVPLDTFDWVSPWLAYLGYQPLVSGVLSADELRYLQSAWLEHYVREMICQQLQLPLEATAVGIQLHREGADWKYRNNEFDVLFLYRNRLHIVECKTAMRRNRRETKTIFNNTLHKLAALQREFGLNVRVSLLTLSDQLRERKQGVRRPVPDYNLRAELFDISIIDYDCLLAGPEQWLPHLLQGSGLTSTIESV